MNSNPQSTIHNPQPTTHNLHANVSHFVGRLPWPELVEWWSWPCPPSVAAWMLARVSVWQSKQKRESEGLEPLGCPSSSLPSGVNRSTHRNRCPCFDWPANVPNLPFILEPPDSARRHVDLFSSSFPPPALLQYALFHRLRLFHHVLRRPSPAPSTFRQKSSLVFFARRLHPLKVPSASAAALHLHFAVPARFL